MCSYLTWEIPLLREDNLKMVFLRRQVLQDFFLQTQADQVTISKAVQIKQKSLKCLNWKSFER